MTLPPWLSRLDGMGTNDTSDVTEGGDGEPKVKGFMIGDRLRELSHALGLNQRQLAIRLGQDPKHFNAWWHNKRRAAFNSIADMARAAGRSLAWMFGEEEARPMLGTADALGRVTMESKDFRSGVIYFVEAGGPFPVGKPVFVDASDAFVPGEWLLIGARDGDARWFAWAFRHADLEMLRRIDGEEVRYLPARRRDRGSPGEARTGAVSIALIESA